MATLITPMDPGPGTGPRLAVKDLIDVAGVPTTAASRAVAEDAAPADGDAACVSAARAGGARIVGKANLHELAFGASGVNEWTGTPVNPLDGRLVPGGSSSGSAVAVADDVADVAIGSDTGGSIRIPSAFCGTVGVKPTYGRVSVDGVRPLAVSLDVVGPMARTVRDVAMGLQLLDPTFDAIAVGASSTPLDGVLRLRPIGVQVDPLIDAAVDAALRAAGLSCIEETMEDWMEAYDATTTILESEAAAANRTLLEDPQRRDKLGAGVRDRLSHGAAVPGTRVEEGRRFATTWRSRLERLLARAPILALPTVPFFPPPLGEAGGRHYTVLTNPFNLAGLPAVSLPVPTDGPLPAGLQLVGAAMSEAELLAAALLVEQAVQA